MRNPTFGSGPRPVPVNSSSYGGKIIEVVKDQFARESDKSVGGHIVMPGSDKHIVITTINGPQEAIYKFRSWPGWRLIVIGDKKTPQGWNCEGVTYLGIEEQHEEFGELAKAIPENTYARKMLGYVYAIRHGAKAIFESDDDNIPYKHAAQSVEWFLSPQNRVKGMRRRSANGWLNIYKLFGASACWPRGFPLEYVSDPASKGNKGMDNKPWAVAQFLADKDPDVDAVYRMVMGQPVHFSRNRRFIVDEGTYCPINSQATLWMPETYPLLFLPLGVTDRVTDILRGYIALSCLWKTGHSAVFSSPLVYQERNFHNLHRDFQMEMKIYENANSWARMLSGVVGKDPVSCYRSAIQSLQEIKAISPANREVYELFLYAAGLIRKKT